MPASADVDAMRRAKELAEAMTVLSAWMADNGPTLPLDVQRAIGMMALTLTKGLLVEMGAPTVEADRALDAIGWGRSGG